MQMFTACVCVCVRKTDSDLWELFHMFSCPVVFCIVMWNVDEPSYFLREETVCYGIVM